MFTENTLKFGRIPFDSVIIRYKFSPEILSRRWKRIFWLTLLHELIMLDILQKGTITDGLPKFSKIFFLNFSFYFNFTGKISWNVGEMERNLLTSYFISKSPWNVCEMESCLYILLLRIFWLGWQGCNQRKNTKKT